MKIIFSPRATDRLRQIRNYISEDSPINAIKTISRIRQVIELLSGFPELGKLWRKTDTRAIVVAGLPYRIHYMINQKEDCIEIITIAHTSQRPPDIGE